MTAPDSGAVGPAYGQGAMGQAPAGAVPGQVRAAAPGAPYGAAPPPGQGGPPPPPGGMPYPPPGGPLPPTEPEVPPVPAGPGVRPPFSAPPVHKEGGTLALWTILGGFTLLLCLVGGGVGAGGAVISAFNETDREARAVAADYLDAIADERFSDAYRMTCKPLRREIDEQEFIASKRQNARVVDYELSTIQAMQDGRFLVPAELELDSGNQQRIGLVMAREPVGNASAGPDAKSEFRVCGEVDDPAPGPS